MQHDRTRCAYFDSTSLEESFVGYRCTPRFRLGDRFNSGQGGSKLLVPWPFVEIQAGR